MAVPGQQAPVLVQVDRQTDLDRVGVRVVDREGLVRVRQLDVEPAPGLGFPLCGSLRRDRRGC